LIADDHAGVAKMLEDLLSPHCDVVGVVQDGGGVPDAAARLAPVITLLDLNMPTVHGLDACRQIIRANPGAKVIIMSGMIDDVIVEEAIAAGAVDCIPKARAASQLLPAIVRAWQDR
jgi:DNA-binding NarL/FixJ family response regulator